MYQTGYRYVGRYLLLLLLVITSPKFHQKLEPGEEVLSVQMCDIFNDVRDSENTNWWAWCVHWHVAEAVRAE